MARAGPGSPRSPHCPLPMEVATLGLRLPPAVSLLGPRIQRGSLWPKSVRDHGSEQGQEGPPLLHGGPPTPTTGCWGPQGGPLSSLSLCPSSEGRLQPATLPRLEIQHPGSHPVGPEQPCWWGGGVQALNLIRGHFNCRLQGLIPWFSSSRIHSFLFLR